MFTFFLQSYRKGILTFCGENMEVNFDVNGDDGKIIFKRFDNGEFKGINQNKLITRHSNISKGVIVGKKSWGLWVNEWSDGISEGSFTKKEILDEFEKRNIIIPEPLLLDFENRIYKKVIDKIHGCSSMVE